MVDRALLSQNLRNVLHCISDVYSQASSMGAAVSGGLPRLVAVSKTFPAECVVICYDEGQRHFGENYLHELVEKSEVIGAKCPDIRWHFIGRIQSNKIRKLCEIRGLWCIETLDSEKHSSILQKCCVELGLRQLNVFIQVNTSGEENKGGVDLTGNALPQLARHIVSNCPNLKLKGLMTIGSLTQSQNEEANQNFAALVSARQRIIADLNLIDIQPFELSMGMSQDFEVAIRYGATNVRVGSSIFGARNYSV